MAKTPRPRKPVRSIEIRRRGDQVAVMIPLLFCSLTQARQYAYSMARQGNKLSPHIRTLVADYTRPSRQRRIA